MRDLWKGMRCKWSEWRGLSDITGCFVCTHPEVESFGLPLDDDNEHIACDPDKCWSFEQDPDKVEE